MLDSKQLGQQGEEEAAKYLIHQGYRLLHRNYETVLGEIDIVAFSCQENEYVFVEVKTRSSVSFGEPYLAVNEKKKMKYRNLAMIYLQRQCVQEPAYRFDIISVVLNRWNGCLVQLDHYENAFV